jgi:hypothetical protein
VIPQPYAPRMTSTTTLRFAAGLLAAGATLASLSACSFGSDNVSCTASSCTATLSGEGADADILGTKVQFAGTKDGRATLGVAGANVSCAEGEKVGAGPLTITCSSVTDDAVEITASLG